MTTTQGIGFQGNADIYGIGIRVGYYTQAASLWVANFYAQHEAPYLHTVTILFLIALLIGICGFCKDPSTIHAVEPFMLMQVAYNTMFMGLWDQSPPELLQWELHVKKRILVDLVWISLHGFDNWYWWTGLWKMQPTNAEHGNNVFYPYVGQVDLFKWVKHPARIFNAYMLLYLALDFFFVCVYTRQQRHSDHAIAPARLKQLAEQWYRNLDGFKFARSEDAPTLTVNSELQSTSEDGEHLEIYRHSRGTSQQSTHAAGSERPLSESHASSRTPGPVPFDESDKSVKELSKHMRQKTDEIPPPPYRRATRTSTGLLKRGLMRWSSNKEHDLSSPPPLHTPYEPTFEGVNAAADLLISSTMPPIQSRRFNWLRKLPNCFLSLVCLIPALMYNRFRPSVILAILSHAHNMERCRTVSYPKALTLALRNPSYRTLNSKDIVVASRMLLTLHTPPLPTRWMRIGVGWATFGACSILVIGTELTIQWNEIKGVQQLDSVGQLIPFCLGTGGLLRVIWAALMEREWRDKDRWCYFGRCNAADRRDLWKAASKEFQQCRDLADREAPPSANMEKKTDV